MHAALAQTSVSVVYDPITRGSFVASISPHSKAGSMLSGINSLEVVG